MEIKISAQEVQVTLDAARSGATADAVEAFKKLGILKCKEAAPILIVRITDKDPEIRLVCVQESVDILGKAAVKYLDARLEDTVINIAMAAASQLAYLGTQKAAEALLRAANSSNPIIETNGAYGLGFWNSKEGTKVLLEAVSNTGYNYRGAAALALGQIGGKKIPPALVKAFNHATDEDEKMQIAAALTMLGDDQREIIREGLQSQLPGRKLVALFCIRALKDKGAFLDIVPLLKDTNVNVAQAAEDTLEEIGATQKERRLISKREQAKCDIRKALPEGYQLEADE